MATTKQKLIGDQTRTARAGAYLERLEKAKGKRLVVDLDAPARRALEALLEAGYEASQKGVVIKALMTAVFSRFERLTILKTALLGGGYFRRTLFFGVNKKTSCTKTRRTLARHAMV